jgi:hypothetical protein
MRFLHLVCATCGLTRADARRDCVYERLAVEACPCPRCGAYTLGLHAPTAHRRHPRLRLPASEVENRRRAG